MNFIDQYSNNQIQTALKLLEDFKQNVKYFKYKEKDDFWGEKINLYKLNNVRKSDVFDVQTVHIECTRVEIFEPSEDVFIERIGSTISLGPKTFTFQLTKLFGSQTQLTNLEGINDMVDFFNRVEVVKENEAKEVYKVFHKYFVKKMEELSEIPDINN